MLPRLGAACAALFFLYLFGLNWTGLIGPDEPRYAEVGREMAQSGDLVTPRLWGKPWFEKPILLYWMTAAGFRLGGGEDLAPRLPVALLSCGFVLYFWWALRRDFGERAAWFGAAVLATSVGWIAYSRVAVTDLPMAVFFGSSLMLLPALPVAAGLCLGLAVLAKGLVPLVLLAPALFFYRWRAGAALAMSIALALPWYALVTIRNGRAFVDEFFWKHHFGRFTDPALQHVRPFWFYLPVLAGLLIPWTPALVLCVRKWTEGRLRFYAATALWGLVFFSAARNKLPGYLIPLLPPIAALIGVALDRAKNFRMVVLWCAVLTGLLPVAAAALPQALRSGLSHTGLRNFGWASLGLAAAVAVYFIRERRCAVLFVAAVNVICVTILLVAFSGAVDRAASARGIREAECAPSRNLKYGLSYYAQKPVDDCEPAP